MNSFGSDTNDSGADDIKLLLPWYVNGTLAADERALVEQHLDHCHDCRESVGELRQIASAVMKGEPTPLVPEPPVANFLDKAFAAKKPAPASRPIPGFAIAASLLALIAVAYWLIASLPQSNVFQTVTDPGRNAEITYVFDFETTPGTAAAVRAAVAEGFGGDVVRSGDGYRLSVSMPSATMKELDAFADVLRQIEGVQKVEIVGVQLPVE